MKRKVKQNIWGNWNGYEGNRRVQEFGTDELGAKDWLENKDQFEKTRQEFLSTPLSLVTTMIYIENLIKKFHLTQSYRLENRTIYKGYGSEYYLNELDCEFMEEGKWGNAFRRVYVNYEKQLVFSYVEGDLLLSIPDSPEAFLAEIESSEKFYSEN